MEPDSAGRRAKMIRIAAGMPNHHRNQPTSQMTNWYHQVDDGQSVQQRQVVARFVRIRNMRAVIETDSPANGRDG